MVVQSDVRLTVIQAVIPEEERDIRSNSCSSGCWETQRERHIVPEQERHVALLALSALHGAVQRHTGVSERKVVQLAVHVVCVAFKALKYTDVVVLASL